MTTAYFGNTSGNQALAATMLQSGLYLACFLEDPTPLGTGLELAGGDYIRQPITFSNPSAKTVVSTIACTFTGLVAAMVEYLAVMTDVSAGTLVVAFELDPFIEVLDSGQLLVPSGDIAFAL
jgi:hypothetical protein